MRLTVDEDELFEITNRRRLDARAKVLTALRIPFQIRPDNTILVYRAHLPLPKDAQPANDEPDWGSLHAARKKA